MPTPPRPTTTIVHLLRHGEVFNPTKILYGRLPGFRLSDYGQRQAQAVAEKLCEHEIAAVIASPLQRARETAAPLATSLGYEIGTDEDLIESGNDFEGLHIKGLDSALWNPVYWPKLHNPLAPSWGEPYEQIAQRMLAAVDRARTAHAGKEVVLVSHQLPIYTLRRYVEGLALPHNPAVRQCELASVTSLVYLGESLIDVIYSEPAKAVVRS